MKIVLCGGGTGGHIMPNLALIPLLNNHFSEIHYIAGLKDKELITTACPSIIFHLCNSPKLSRPVANIKNLIIPLSLLKAKNQAITILKQIKPDIVFGKGGYASLPILMAAKKLGIPYVIHESDMSMGLANKLCAKAAAKCLSSYTNATKKLKNGLATGSPIRSELYNSDKTRVDTLQFDHSLPTVLIVGGSSGAKTINACVRVALPMLTKKYNVIHITGNGNTDDHRQRNYIQLPFVLNIGDYINASDMVITRAGSNTLFELVALNKPTLAIPLPKSTSRGDQIENAKYFLDKGCILTLDQKDLTPTSLVDKIHELMQNKSQLIKACQSEPNIDGTKNIVDILVGQLKK